MLSETRSLVTAAGDDQRQSIDIHTILAVHLMRSESILIILFGSQRLSIHFVV